MKEAYGVIVVGREGEARNYMIQGEKEARAFAEVMAKYSAIVVLKHWDGRKETITKKDDVP